MMTLNAPLAALPPLFMADLDRTFELLPEATWRQLAGRRLFLTGGTGFVGKWLLASLLDVSRRLDLACHVTVLSRSPEAFMAQAPELARAPNVQWMRGDVRSLETTTGSYDTVIHAATDVVARNAPQTTFDTCVEGTRRVLDFARAAGAKDFLLVSSGAVYGRQPSTLRHTPETFTGAPDPLSASSAYGEGKRAAEWLSCAAGVQSAMQVKIARCFAFVGPYLPLDKQFAIGNFIGAALSGQEIVIQGDGTPYRSYLYAADMAAWLWAILLRGAHGRAYNVGAEEDISIAELAATVQRVLGSHSPIRVLTPASPGREVDRYVPDTSRARGELELPPPLPLDDALLRTSRWLGALR